MTGRLRAANERAERIVQLAEDIYEFLGVMFVVVWIFALLRFRRWGRQHPRAANIVAFGLWAGLMALLVWWFA